MNIKLPAARNSPNHTAPTAAAAAAASAVPNLLLEGWSSKPAVYLYLLILCVVWIIYILLNPRERIMKHEVPDTLMVERRGDQDEPESNCMCRRLHHRGKRE